MEDRVPGRVDGKRFGSPLEALLVPRELPELLRGSRQIERVGANLGSWFCMNGGASGVYSGEGGVEHSDIKVASEHIVHYLGLLYRRYRL